VEREKGKKKGKKKEVAAKPDAAGEPLGAAAAAIAGATTQLQSVPQPVRRSIQTALRMLRIAAGALNNAIEELEETLKD
jgi:ABC-type transporter Mla subunit MlaD